MVRINPLHILLIGRWQVLPVKEAISGECCEQSAIDLIKSAQ